MINQIKEAYENATNKGNWVHNGNEFVSELNSRVGIGGFLTDADNELVQLLITNGRNLLDELEKVQRDNEELKWKVAHPVICQGICTSQNDDYCGMHMHNESCIACNAIWTNAHVENKEWDMKRLRDEHSAMKDALEWYKDAHVSDVAKDGGKLAISTLSNITKGEPA